MAHRTSLSAAHAVRRGTTRMFQGRNAFTAAVIAVLLLLTAPNAWAAWTPAQVVSGDFAPRAAWAWPSGDFGLTGADRTRWRRWSWPVDAAHPVPVGAGRLGGVFTDPPWRVDDAGDVLAVHRGDRSFQVRLLGADGSVIAGFAPAARSDSTLEKVASVLGADGTAVVAWTRGALDSAAELPAVWITVRAPGGGFGPVREIGAPGEVREIDVSVGADQRPELVFAAWDGADHHMIFHVQGAPDGEFAAPVQIASTTSGSPFPLIVIAGAPGRGRVLFGVDESDLGSCLRTAPDGWSPAQRLGAGSDDFFTIATALADGGAALAYVHEGRLTVRRAATGGPFGAAEVIRRLPPGWVDGEKTIAVDHAGDLLVAWSEALIGAPGSGQFVFGRVLAAFAPAGWGFGAAEALSPLGTSLADAGAVAAALSDHGGRLVAWHTNETAVSARSLMAARGSSAPDTVTAARPRRPPTLAVLFSERALRRAARGAPLRGRMSCSRRCAVHVEFAPADLGTVDRPEPFSLNSLRSRLLLPGSSMRPARWTLNRSQRKKLHYLLRDAPKFGLAVEATAVDAAGGYDGLRRVIRRPRATREGA